MYVLIFYVQIYFRQKINLIEFAFNFFHHLKMPLHMQLLGTNAFQICIED